MNGQEVRGTTHPHSGRGPAALLARLLLALAYRIALWADTLGRRWRPRPVRRLLVTGTFHNPNWYRAHLRPLAECGLDELLVVTDEPPPPLAGVRVVCPSALLRRICGRNGSKLLTLIWQALRRRPDAVMGYHLFPGAITALIAARVCGAAAIYQMTAGPIEIADGGLLAENRVMSAIGRPSPRIERLAQRLARRFDALVVRGRRAERFLRDHGVERIICIIPGSVQPPSRPSDEQRRDIDLLWVGRLAEIKRPELFVDVLERLCPVRPQIQAALLGDGPLYAPLRARIEQRGLGSRVQMPGKVDPIEPWLARARVFVLTSRNEGLSIALGEAMRAGCVPVVSDVGELRELVRDGQTGFVVPPDDPDAFAHAVTRVLDHPQLWNTLSQQAAATAAELMDIHQVADRWRACFARLAGQPLPARQPRRAAPARPAEAPEPVSTLEPASSRQTHG